MKVWKSLMISLSIYSKIPMPQFPWKDEDMKYVLCFFPWVGAVIAGLTILWGWLCGYFQIGTLAFAAVGTVIPILVSGGFHLDGFMDTMDALHSYQSREKKLEILKDSHIGAFAVIQVLVYYFIYLGAYSALNNIKAMAVVGAGFFLSRCLSGIGVVTLRCAKKEGLLYLFSSKAHERAVKIILALQTGLCMAGMLLLSFQMGAAVILGAIITFYYYRYRSYKEFGGITGDTAGYFVTLCEGAIVIIAAIFCIGEFI